MMPDDDEISIALFSKNLDRMIGDVFTHDVLNTLRRWASQIPCHGLDDFVCFPDETFLRSVMGRFSRGRMNGRDRRKELALRDAVENPDLRPTKTGRMFETGLEHVHALG